MSIQNVVKPRPSERGFPIASSAVDVRAFATPVRPRGRSHTFGLNSENAAKSLRELADAIERKAVTIQGVTLTASAKVDDFVMTALTIEYAVPVPSELDFA